MHSLYLLLGTYMLASSHAKNTYNIHLHERPDGNMTFMNPMIPGFHPDPSCIFVEDLNQTFFCTSSSFLTFPGIPIYASRDLRNWKLASRVVSRPSQLPELETTLTSSSEGGIWAPTLREHNGTFYVACTFVLNKPSGSREFENLIFNSTSLYDDDAWSNPVKVNMHNGNAIDPDLFWDDEGTAYMHTGWGKIYQQTIDVQTGESSQLINIWNGTGASNPEGPHIYKKDNYYYLLIAQGGSGRNHAVAMARSTNITGPYVGYSGNPVLTAAGTENFFQGVGHADLFQDKYGNWWGVALGVRSGPAYEVYPMGRETLLFPVTWDGDWPVMDSVFGEMEGWDLGTENISVPGDGCYVGAADINNFEDDKLPSHWVHWRFPDAAAYVSSPDGHPQTLQLSPSSSNLTGNLTTAQPISFVGRRQTASLFDFSIHIEFEPKAPGDEAGITALLTQLQHFDLGITISEDGAQAIQLKAITDGSTDQLQNNTLIREVPESWYGEEIILTIKMDNPSAYTFGAALAADPADLIDLGSINATYLTAGSGGYTGVILGIYNTNNGGEGNSNAWFNQWNYTDVAQEIDNGLIIYASG